MKKFVKIFLLIALSFSISNAFSQKISEIDKAQIELSTRGEVHFSFNISSPQDVLELTRIISIDNFKNNIIEAYANQSEFDKFLDYDIPFTVIERESAPKTTVTTTVAGMASWDKYPSYDVYVQMMNQFETDYPTLCRVVNIGNSFEGRQILVAKISDNVDVDEDEPEYLYTSSMHGDEICGITILLRLIDYLLSNYGTDPQVTNLVNNIEIWINPEANPDGTYNGGNTNVSNATRYNAQGIDLNRNYPSMTGGAHPDGNPYTTETTHFMNFADAHNFNMCGNFHGGAEVVNFPWDHWTTATNAHADDNWWQYVSHIYADNAQADAATVGMNSYFTSVTSNGITEGGDWYIVDGSRQDWMTYYKYARETTLEIHNTKLLAATSLPNYWIANKQALLDYMEEVLYGIRGIITDGCTGQPMVAKVEIVGHDQDNSEVYSNLPVGNYHRPIYAGTYNVTYSAPGYQSQTINNITVTNGNTVIQNVVLTPAAPVADFSASETTTCNGTIDFTCITQGVDTWLWNFGDGNTSTQENPTHTYTANGTYNVSLTVTNCSGLNSDQLVQNNYITINAPSAPLTNGSSNCGPGTVDLSASGSGNLEWYDVSTGGTSINSGTTYTTPSISNTTTYYVENVVSSTNTYYVGSTNSSANGGQHNGSFYITFDAYVPLVIKSVEINAASAGNVSIDLLSGGGATLQSVTVAAPAGISRINVNLNVPVGTGMGLQLTSGGNLWRNNANVSYPYTEPGIVSITGSTAGSGYYYYFYDWEVEVTSSCISGRTPVTATIVTPVNVGISINASTTTICPGDNVNFIASPTNGGTTPTYQWLVNGTPVQTGTSSTYSTTSLVDGDDVTCIITSSTPCNNGPATSNTVSITQSTSVPVSLSISSSATTICNGESVTFTATATNGGTSPIYQWYVNGSPVQTGASNTYSTSLLANGDNVSCVVTSNEPCNDGPASSNNITITVAAGLPVSANISASTTSICIGENITFTATPNNGGTNPSYEWFVNGSSVQTGSSNSFSSTTLTDGDIITCELTSSDLCVTGNPAISNSVSVNVSSNLPVSNAITGNTNFCSGDNVVVISNPTNQGSSPNYEWFVNGSSVQNGSSNSFASTSFNDGDNIYCLVTSSLSCATSNPAYSDTLTMSVSTSLPVSLNITGNNSICNGSSVTLTANAVNQGSSPNYEWFINGSSVQNSSSNTYTSSAFNNSDDIYCIVTSSASCATGSPATSNSIIMTVNSNLPVSVNILADNNPICINDNVTFTANATNGGTTPTYQWKVNGVNTGTNSNTFSTSAINNGDFVSCVLNSSETCVTNNPSTSNNIVMTVNNVPSSGFTFVNTDLVADFTNTSTGATSYMWYFGDGNSTNQPSPLHTYIAEGSYTVTLIAFNSCGSDTTTVNINIIIDGIDDLNTLNLVSIYPNPTKDILNIDFETYNNEEINIEIYSIVGHKLIERKIDKAFGKYNEQFDMSTYKKGIYLLVLKTKSGQTINKIIIE